MYEIGSEFNLERDAQRRNLLGDFTEAAEAAGRYIEFLRCGRDAIGFVADDIIAGFQDDGISRGDGGYKAFLPALACDSMVLPFEVRGYDIVYYKVGDDLSIDAENLLEKLDAASGSDDFRPVVLIMNYFGITETSVIADVIKDKYKDSVIIEDVTHLLMDEQGCFNGSSATDYHVGSIRKWLGVPDGAFAVSKKEFLMGALTGETDFTALRRDALLEKTEYLDNGDEELKTHFRSLLSDAEDSLSDGLDPYHISDVSADILSDIDVAKIRYRRSVNYSILYKKLLDLPLCGKAFRALPEIAKTEDGDLKHVPFMLPIVLDVDFMRRSAITDEGKSITRDGFERKLAERGIYAPVLWPILDGARSACEKSAYFSDNMLAFWIDQRYDRFDMEQVARAFNEELSKL
ncbi:hypothetical protein [Butyrivibrio sp. VCD2006]|uniref:hypothetical protein n=1 Tax=Butyrivibrio sp. VCD2006 TaxID=1280664 RepID=UPI0003F50319|nr:hypothetical protein [Butyrivibrio sp. VCD2006]